MLELNQCYNENCLATMSQMPDGFVDLVVTSPPYDNLRSYKGYSFEFEKVAKELFRVIKPGGVIIWVVGDSTVNGSESGTSFKQALFFKETGFNLHDTMIYAKKNYIPLTHNRYEQGFEYMFCFSKGRPKTFNPIKELCKMAGQKRGKNTYRHTGEETMPGHSLEGNYNDTKTKSNLFFYSTNAAIKGHPAIFPEPLAEDMILSWSNEGDLVYDPFTGSGTTLKMAKLHKRNYLGSEVSPEYCQIINKRLEETVLPLTNP